MELHHIEALNMENLMPEQQPEKLPSMYFKAAVPLQGCPINFVKKGGQWRVTIYAPEKCADKQQLKLYHGLSIADCFYQLEVRRQGRRTGLKLQGWHQQLPHLAVKTQLSRCVG